MVVFYKRTRPAQRQTTRIQQKIDRQWMGLRPGKLLLRIEKKNGLGQEIEPVFAREQGHDYILESVSVATQS